MIHPLVSEQDSEYFTSVMNHFKTPKNLAPKKEDGCNQSNQSRTDRVFHLVDDHFNTVQDPPPKKEDGCNSPNITTEEPNTKVSTGQEFICLQSKNILQ